ncbi:peptidase [Brachybacterium vulturis]|uniref:Peptidase n=1 Tax=Brachybacterium vulturis TaxID=2017484 RepID=A0A291GMR6_9MICO|nr:PepSY domain-containing protein [Brachybacterium vulturis]ATG51447.1 peptidase [Brachybacterium vulturis]
MTRTILRPRSTARAAALGALVIALAAGCGGTEQGEDGAAPADEPGTAQDGGASDGGGDSEAGAPAEDDATADGAASDGGAEAPDEQDPAAEALPADADLATAELPITAERAIEIATETTGGGDLVQIEIDHDDRAGAWEWEIVLLEEGTQHELDIDATTGEVTEHESDEDDDQDPVVDVTAPMTPSEAIEIALGQEPGRVSGWELDSDSGTIRYQIDIDRAEGGDVEVEVDVETGDVRIDD